MFRFKHGAEFVTFVQALAGGSRLVVTDAGRYLVLNRRGVEL